MNHLRIRTGHREVAAYLAGGAISERIAALIRRWGGPGRPGLLLILDSDPPSSGVYSERELLETFPDAPVVQALPIGDLGPGRLLVVLIDEEGEIAYAIPDPRALN